MTIDERDLTPKGVFTMFTTFPLEPSLAADATARITGEPPNRPRDGVRIRDEDGPYDDAHLDGPASGYTMVAVDMDDAEAYGATVPEDGRWRPKLVHPRGRWRTKKRALRQLADELGYPKCMEVAHDDQIVGAVLQAGVRLRDWRRFERSGRRWRERHRLLRIAKPLLRAAQRLRAATGEISF